MKDKSVNINRLRSYASILSNTVLGGMIRQNDSAIIQTKINKYDKEKTNSGSWSYNRYFQHIYNSLLKDYRNEYVYKNTIINKLLLGRYSLNTTTALNEFRVGNSIADLVLLNGSSKVFEIKTELDSQERLGSQLQDYQKVFEEIYLVTYQGLETKYLNLLPEEIGLVTLNQRNSLSTIRKAIPRNSFDPNSLMKCLRKREYSNIILDYYGCLPSVSDFKFYKACKEILYGIPVIEFQKRTMIELKKRRLKENEFLSSSVIPMELKHICLCLDLDKPEYLRLSKILSQTINA